jgi:hypothetical protein
VRSNQSGWRADDDFGAGPPKPLGIVIGRGDLGLNLRDAAPDRGKIQQRLAGGDAKSPSSADRMSGARRR